MVVKTAFAVRFVASLKYSKSSLGGLSYNTNRQQEFFYAPKTFSYGTHLMFSCSFMLFIRLRVAWENTSKDGNFWLSSLSSGKAIFCNLKVKP